MRQYIEPLASLGIAMHERFPAATAYPPARRWLRPAWFAASLAQRIPAVIASQRADLTLLQREFVSTLATLEACTRAPRVLDVDDAIHLARGGAAARALARRARLVVCGNRWLAEVYAEWAAEVAVLPTAIDVPASAPPRSMAWDSSGAGARLAWIGTAGNLRYLDGIAEALAAVMARWPRLRLAVCCDRAPRLPGISAERVDFIAWSPTAEASFLGGSAIGLMPLADGDWERGKCSFKMLQYLAAGWPCVVSPVGMNAEVLAAGAVGFGARTIAEWVDALDALLRDPAQATALGSAGHAVARERYSVAALAPRLADLLRRAAA